MDLGRRFRITCAAAIALAAAASVVLATGVTAGPPAEPLLPDLRTMRPPDWDPLRLQGQGEKLAIRISNRVGNRGAGPLELYPEPATNAGGFACTPGEYPDPHDRNARQRIWEDSNANGIWDGPGSSQPDQVAEEEKVGCFEYHPPHEHWHFQDFSSYKLTDPDTGDTVAGPSRKIGFCILDGDRFDATPPYPNVYPGGDAGCGGAGEPPDPPVPPGTMGLSVGWADTYNSSLPGQKLSIAGVERGLYCLKSTANPAHASGDQAQIIESNPANNTRDRLVRLNPDRGKIKLAGGPCET